MNKSYTLNWTVQKPNSFPSYAEAKSRTSAGLELHAFGDGRWQVFTRINGVHIMASGETSNYSLFKDSPERLTSAQEAATKAAAILESAGAKGGF